MKAASGKPCRNSSTGASDGPATRHDSVMPWRQRNVDAVDSWPWVGPAVQHHRGVADAGLVERREQRDADVGLVGGQLAERLLRRDSASRASLRLSLSDLVSMTSSLTEPCPRAARRTRAAPVEVGEAQPRVDISTTAGQAAAAARGSRPSPAASAAWRPRADRRA
jgi:hypothetical protein